MKNQIYIFLVIIAVSTSCKTDVKPFEEEKIKAIHYYYPREITRDNSSFPLFANKSKNIEVVFDNNPNSDNYNLYLFGNDSIQFTTENDCLKKLTIGDIINESTKFSTKGSVDIKADNFSCELIDTSYVGVKLTFSNSPHREQFGYLKIIQGIKGYWIAEEFVWNTANHQPIIVGQK